MTPSGYSGTPLAKKLGIKEGGHIYLKGAPPNFEATLEGLPAKAIVSRSARAGALFDVIVAFTKSAAALAREFVPLEKRLAAGLVDNKVCAIDETWSGLRFMRRRANR